MKTLISYVYFETPESLYNLEFFIHSALKTDGDVYLVINGEKCSLELPSNLKVIKRPNIGFDTGGHKSVLDIVNVSDYDYFIFLNSSVIGPFLPTYYTKDWTCVFTDLITDKVKLVGTSISWLSHNDKGGYGPKVEGFAWCTDRIGLQLLMNKKTIFYDHKTKDDAIINGEYAITKCILEANYNIDCLLYKYQGLNWLEEIKKKSFSPNFPSRKGSYDEISIHPFEVVFHKWCWSNEPTNLVSWEFVDKYRNWKLTKKLTQKLDKKEISFYYGPLTKNPNFTTLTNNKFILTNKIIDTNFNKYLGDPYLGIPKYLQLFLDDKKFLIKENCKSENVFVSEYKSTPEIIVVYYGLFRKDVECKSIIYNQLLELSNSGLLSKSKLYICLSVESDKVEKSENPKLQISKIQNEISKIIKSEIKFVIDVTNSYEFISMDLIWNLSQTNQNSLFVYFHSREITKIQNCRLLEERKMFQYIINFWKYAILIFEQFPNVDVLDILSSKEESRIWFNTWWAKGSHIRNCKKPIVSNNKFDYEMCFYSNNNFNLIKRQPFAYGNLHQACDLLEKTHLISNIEDFELVYI